jgi:hypothetical protein
MAIGFDQVVKRKKKEILKMERSMPEHFTSMMTILIVPLSGQIVF